MSTHPYKLRSKPSRRSVRMNNLNTMIRAYKYSGEWVYDGEPSTMLHMDEMAMWQTANRKSRRKGMTIDREYHVGNAGPEFATQWAQSSLERQQLLYHISE